MTLQNMKGSMSISRSKNFKDSRNLSFLHIYTFSDWLYIVNKYLLKLSLDTFFIVWTCSRERTAEYEKQGEIIIWANYKISGVV